MKTAGKQTNLSRLKSKAFVTILKNSKSIKGGNRPHPRLEKEAQR